MQKHDSKIKYSLFSALHQNVRVKEKMIAWYLTVQGMGKTVGGLFDHHQSTRQCYATEILIKMKLHIIICHKMVPHVWKLIEPLSSRTFKNL